MDRLVYSAVEGFLNDVYGGSFCARVVERTLNDETRSRARPNSQAGAVAVMAAAAEELNKSLTELWEDLGAWLAQRKSIRRLLRFSGRDFADFLFGLPEFPDYVRLVVPDASIPPMTVLPKTDMVQIIVHHPGVEWQHVMTGLVRAMADDYGVLGLVSSEEDGIAVQISDEAFAEAREFRLAAGVAMGQAS